jgi:hypothetical protein
MENVMVIKQRLLVLAAALVLALSVSASVAGTAEAMRNSYDSCANPRMVNPEYGGCPYGSTDPNSDVS